MGGRVVAPDVLRLGRQGEAHPDLPTLARVRDDAALLDLAPVEQHVDRAGADEVDDVLALGQGGAGRVEEQELTGRPDELEDLVAVADARNFDHDPGLSVGADLRPNGRLGDAEARDAPLDDGPGQFDPFRIGLPR